MNRLRFYLNKKLDERMIGKFLNEGGGGIDFGRGITNLHPKLESVRLLKSVNQRKKVIRVYVDHYYQTHRRTIYQSIERLRRTWPKREKEYIAVTENFFGGFQFPRGKYIAYASIVDCNPRFLDSKTFQFFYKKPLADVVHTITHELLHFIFFDFLKKNFKKEIKLLSEGQLWALSEIFNVVTLKSPRYRHIINQRFVIPYPDHKHYIYRLEKIYKNSQKAKELIRQGTTILKAKN